MEDASTIPLHYFKRHYDVRNFCSASIGMPFFPPETPVMILKMSIGVLLSLAMIICLMTSAKKARKRSGLPNIAPESSSLFTTISLLSR